MNSIFPHINLQEKKPVLWYLYILDLEQEVSRQSSYIDLHSRFVLHLPECDYIIKELHPLRNTKWPLFVPDVIIAFACCRKPPVWRHTHVTVVHVTKACRSGLSERSHVFTGSQRESCADLRGRGGGIEPYDSSLSSYTCFVRYIWVAKNIITTAAKKSLPY